MSQPLDDLLPPIAAYYSAKLADHGVTPQGVDWNGPDSHNLRHEQFLRLMGSDHNASVLDLGCGFGDFHRFLKTAGYRGFFTGYDISPEMIEAARRTYGQQDGNCRWIVDASPAESADYAIASGVFNVKGDVADVIWKAYVERNIDMLAGASRRGFAFNVLSLSSDADRRRENLYYADPVETLAFCLSRYGRNVALLQDYGLYEFTIVVRHPA